MALENRATEEMLTEKRRPMSEEEDEDSEVEHENSCSEEEEESVSGGADSSQAAKKVKLSTSRALRKGAWVAEEDDKLRQVLDLLGGANTEVHSKWSTVASHIPGRSAKQCRERWCYNLDPSICKGPWSAQEDSTLVSSHAMLGNRWAHIASKLPGRTENSVKSRFKSLVRAQKRAWAPEEDATILRMHHKVGCKWAVIAEMLTNRTKNAVKTRYRAIVRGGAQLSQKPQLQLEKEPKQRPSLLAKRSRPTDLTLDIDNNNSIKCPKQNDMSGVSSPGVILQALEQKRFQDYQQQEQRWQGDKTSFNQLLALQAALSSKRSAAPSVLTPRSGSAAINGLINSLAQESQPRSAPIQLVTPRSFESMLELHNGNKLVVGTSDSMISNSGNTNNVNNVAASTTTPQSSPIVSPFLTPQISPRQGGVPTSGSMESSLLTSLVSQLLQVKREQERQQERESAQQQLVELSLALLQNQAKQHNTKQLNNSEVAGMSAMLALAGNKSSSS